MIDKIRVSGNLRPFDLRRMQGLGHIAPGQSVVELAKSSQLILGRIERLQPVAKLSDRILRRLQSLCRLPRELCIALERGVPQAQSRSLRVRTRISLRLLGDRIAHPAQVRIRILRSEEQTS